jgi:hypothetical protein
MLIKKQKQKLLLTCIFLNHLTNIFIVKSTLSIVALSL